MSQTSKYILKVSLKELTVFDAGLSKFSNPITFSCECGLRTAAFADVVRPGDMSSHAKLGLNGEIAMICSIDAIESSLSKSIPHLKLVMRTQETLNQNISPGTNFKGISLGLISLGDYISSQTMFKAQLIPVEMRRADMAIAELTVSLTVSPVPDSAVALVSKMVYN